MHIRSPAGRRRRTRWKRGLYSAEIRAEQKLVRELLQSSRELLNGMRTCLNWEHIAIQRCMGSSSVFPQSTEELWLRHNGGTRHIFATARRRLARCLRRPGQSCRACWSPLERMMTIWTEFGVGSRIEDEVYRQGLAALRKGPERRLNSRLSGYRRKTEVKFS